MRPNLLRYFFLCALVGRSAWAIECHFEDIASKYASGVAQQSLLKKGGPNQWVRLKLNDGSELDGWITDYYLPSRRFNFVETGSSAESEGLRLNESEVQSLTYLGALKVGAEPSARQRGDAYRSKWPNLIPGSRIATTSIRGNERKGVFLGFTPEGDLRFRLDGASGENIALADQLKSISLEAGAVPAPWGIPGAPLARQHWSDLPMGTELQFTSVNGNPHQGKLLGYTAKGNLAFLERDSTKPVEIRINNIETLVVAAPAKPPGSALSVQEIFDLPIGSNIEFQNRRGIVRGTFGDELRVQEEGNDKLTSYPVTALGAVRLVALVPEQTKILDQNVGKLKDSFNPAAIRMAREDGSPRAYLTLDRRTGEIVHVHSGGASGKTAKTHEGNGRLRPDFLQVEAILHGSNKRVEVVSQAGSVDEFYAIGVAEQSLRDFAALPVATPEPEKESAPPPRQPGMLDGFRHLFGR